MTDRVGDAIKGSTKNPLQLPIRSDTILTAVFLPAVHRGYASTTDAKRPKGTDVGWLERGTALPAGTGYSIEGSNVYGCANYIHCIIKQVGKEWDEMYPERPRIAICSISKQGGGYRHPSRSHQNGLDIDVRYVRNDGEGPCDFRNKDDLAAYDQEATQDLIGMFAAKGASVVVVDDGHRSGIPVGGIVTELAEHYHHFHVRFPDPDGAPPAN